MSIVTNDDAAAFAELAAVFCTLPLPVAIVDLETTVAISLRTGLLKLLFYVFIRVVSADINGWLIRSSQSAILLLN